MISTGISFYWNDRVAAWSQRLWLSTEIDSVVSPLTLSSTSHWIKRKKKRFPSAICKDNTQLEINDEEQMNDKLEVGKKRKKHKSASLPEYETKEINEGMFLEGRVNNDSKLRWHPCQQHGHLFGSMKSSSGYIGNQDAQRIIRLYLHLDLISRTIKARANKHNYMRRAQARIRQQICNLIDEQYRKINIRKMMSWVIEDPGEEAEEFGKEVRIGTS
ncbi:6018_t:CDS:2 [Diversispora eburnea]|uniref:6018_t:CDS:1 n=1 Tax=Diversispora eburnea TaxID=1213867 RepID=A0A9N8YVU6_9GLOM|nr:6018_t:CDS:2 [Diversispora eburnea]